MGKKIKSGKLVRSAGHPGRMNVGEPVYSVIAHPRKMKGLYEGVQEALKLSKKKKSGL